MKPKWMDVAERFRGIKEVKGKRDNPQIMRFFELVGRPDIKHDETSWCAATVGACLALSGYPHTGSLLAKSYLKYGTAVSRPRYGDIVVLDSMIRNAEPWQGHVGFLIEDLGNKVRLLSGNSGNRLRLANYPKSKVIAYRRPKELGTSRTIKAAVAAKTSLLTSGALGASEQALTEQLGTWQTFADWLPLAKYVCIAIAVMLLIRVVWVKADDNATAAAGDDELRAELEGL